MNRYTVSASDYSEETNLCWTGSKPWQRSTHPKGSFVHIRYDNYLSYHKKQFSDSIGLCPKWSLVGFYVDEGASPPYMESAPAWSRLLEDCMDGKVDLILTQKVSNVSKCPDEISFCARMLASQSHPIGIYFISEDIFTLASYYLEELIQSSVFPYRSFLVSPHLFFCSSYSCLKALSLNHGFIYRRFNG